MKSRILLVLVILTIVLASGCTGENKQGVNQGLNCSDSGMDVKHVYTDCWNMAWTTEIENNGSISLNDFKMRTTNATYFSIDFDLQPNGITLKSGETTNLSFSFIDAYDKLNQSGFIAHYGYHGAGFVGKYQVLSQTCPENAKITLLPLGLMLNPKKVVIDERCTNLSEIDIYDKYGSGIAIQNNGSMQIKIKNRMNESIIIKDMKMNSGTSLSTLDPPIIPESGDVKINPGEEKSVLFPIKNWPYKYSQAVSFAIRFVRESDPNKFIINGGIRYT
jgi:hypothetical protein